jgi:hypothetical protein
MDWWQLRCHIIGNARSLARALDGHRVRDARLLTRPQAMLSGKIGLLACAAAVGLGLVTVRHLRRASAPRPALSVVRDSAWAIARARSALPVGDTAVMLVDGFAHDSAGYLVHFTHVRPAPPLEMVDGTVSIRVAPNGHTTVEGW